MYSSLTYLILCFLLLISKAFIDNVESKNYRRETIQSLRRIRQMYRLKYDRITHAMMRIRFFFYVYLEVYQKSLGHTTSCASQANLELQF